MIDVQRDDQETYEFMEFFGVGTYLRYFSHCFLGVRVLTLITLYLYALIKEIKP